MNGLALRRICLPTASGPAAFFMLGFAVVVGSATLAIWAPIGLSIAAVFLFAGPHNWVELRYFLTRLPSRLAPVWQFFACSFVGIIVLGIAYACLIVVMHFSLLPISRGITIFQGWTFALFAWLVLLIYTKGRWRIELGLVWLSLACALIVGLSQPILFSYAIVYLHPLIGLWILDRELQRSKREWIIPYRILLMIVPLLTFVLIAQLSTSTNLPTNRLLDWQIVSHAGGHYFKQISSHLLVSLHIFLEMLHYGLWLVAIPLAAGTWAKWKPEAIPAFRRSDLGKKVLPFVFLASSLTVFGLWFGFAFDYSTTREIYFTIAIFHILAELPFLIWML